MKEWGDIGRLTWCRYMGLCEKGEKSVREVENSRRQWPQAHRCLYRWELA